MTDFNPVEQLVARVARSRQDRPDTFRDVATSHVWRTHRAPSFADRDTVEFPGQQR